MKKTQITVSYDEEKLSAITMYLEEKGVSVESEIEKAIDTIYNKTVPVPRNSPNRPSRARTNLPRKP